MNLVLNMSLTEKNFEEAGATDIAELTQDTGRSQRLAKH